MGVGGVCGRLPVEVLGFGVELHVDAQLGGLSASGVGTTFATRAGASRGRDARAREAT